MADKVLLSTLDGNIPLEEVLLWISKENYKSEHIRNVNCNRAEFVLYVLNFLRENTAWVLPSQKSLKLTNSGTRVAQFKAPDEIPANLKSPDNYRAHCSKEFYSPGFENRESNTSKKEANAKLSDVNIDVIDADSRLLSPGYHHNVSFERSFSPHCISRMKEEKFSYSASGLDSPTFFSPLSSSVMSDGSPQLTPVHRRVPSFKSSPGTPNASDYNHKTPHKSSGFCLGDFIIKDGKANRNSCSKKRMSTSPPKSPADTHLSEELHQCNSMKKKHRRRINPTKLNMDPSFGDGCSFGPVSRQLPISSPFQETTNIKPADTANGFIEERNLLKQEKLKIQGEQSTSQISRIGLTPPDKHSAVHTTCVPDPNRVSSSEALQKLSHVYCSILNANLVPNLMTELYFVISLLVIQDHHHQRANEVLNTQLEKSLSCLSVDKEILQKHDTSSLQSQSTKGAHKNTMLFSSIHNCVFFAVKTLDCLKNVLECLDRITLRLLCDNERVSLFAPQLTDCLAVMYANASSNNTASGPFATKSFANSNVAFQSDTDNSSNFPSSQSFSSFRKQRDGFYELLRIWEANHMTQGWSFSSALGSRIKNLLQLCNHPTNYMHLARLFRLQLVATVHGEPSIFDGDSPEDLQLQECLRGIDPDKLNRLRERLVAPHKSTGLRPPPSFPGVQEFYRDFILCAYHSVFIQHLQDGLVSHLIELDQTIFIPSDVEETDTKVDDVTRNEYMSTVSTMCLLAKFLGFIVFYPYIRLEGKIPNKIMETEVSIRSKVGSPIDLLGCIIGAFKTRRLVVTVPWVAKYLGMMDVVSSALPVYCTVLRLLLRIYLSFNCQTNNLESNDKYYSLSPMSMLLLRLNIGWLFEAPIVEEAMFYFWCFSEDDRYLIDHPDRQGLASSELTASSPSNRSGIASLTAVDSLNLVDGQVLYALCPYLRELRAVLTSAPAAHSTPGNAARHITPVSASFAMSSPSCAAKQLELQLEESFFHNLPASVYRTVEFVVERVTSACVKHICNVWLRSLKEEGVKKMREKIKKCWDDLESAQDRLSKEAQVIVDEVSSELKLKCQSGIHEVCQMKCQGALLSLLSEESLNPAVCEVCVAISTRMSVERVVSWMKTHATLSMYGKDLQSEIDRALKNKERSEMLAMAKTSHIAPGSSAAWAHNESSLSPSSVLQSLKLLVCSTLDGQSTSKEDILNMLKTIKQTVTERQDVVPAAERTLALLSVDLAVSLACHFPNILDTALLNQMINLWKLDALRPVEDGLARLVCPRNMLLLAQSHHPPRIVWEKLADLVVGVLKAELVSPDSVENQCLAIMQQDWPQNILRCFAMCMTEVVRQYQKLKDVDYKFVLLLEWVAETMAHIEYFPDL